MKYERLESLDVLRGFDLFCLVMFQPVFTSLARVSESPLLQQISQTHFSHVEWEGFCFWDIIMPLFMFMSGVSMPFSFSSYLRGGTSAGAMYRRIFKRFALLFLFGALVQGNLLKFDLHTLRLFSNTLQAIGVGYLVSAIIIMNVRSVKTQLAITIGLLFTFWTVFTFGGDNTPNGNIAEQIDKAVLGRFRDGVRWNESLTAWSFSDSYHYTWILSSLNFVVTVMLGYFAGLILKSKNTWQKKLGWIVAGGVALVALGWMWHLQHPVIKKVWSSSMTLVAGGYCFLLMALFYYVVDVRGWKKQLAWLKPYGMNSIAAYMMCQLLNLKSVVSTLLGGFEQWTGSFQAPLLVFAQAAIVYAILYHLYKQERFFKV